LVCLVKIVYENSTLLIDRNQTGTFRETARRGDIRTLPVAITT